MVLQTIFQILVHLPNFVEQFRTMEVPGSFLVDLSNSVLEVMFWAIFLHVMLIYRLNQSIMVYRFVHQLHSFRLTIDVEVERALRIYHFRSIGFDRILGYWDIEVIGAAVYDTVLGVQLRMMDVSLVNTGVSLNL